MPRLRRFAGRQARRRGRSDSKQRDFVSRALGCSAFSAWSRCLRRVSMLSRSRRPPICIANWRSAASTWRARVGGKADRTIGGRGTRNHSGGAARGVALMVGHVERFNPTLRRSRTRSAMRTFFPSPSPVSARSAAHVQRRRSHRPRRPRHRPHPLVHRLDIAEVQPQLSNAVAEREDIALLQFRTASGVLAHINTNWLTPSRRATSRSRRATSTSWATC